MNPFELPCWPPNWPEIHASVVESLTDGSWGRYRGPRVGALRERLMGLCQTTHVRPVSSGSLGVELALRSAGVGPGASVALCAYDYPGNFRAVELVGGRPVLIDAAEDSFSLAADQLNEISALNSLDAPPIHSVIVSHLYGSAASIGSIRDTCDRQGWKLIEDACQVPGMMVDGKPAGSWGDVGVLSFGGSKPLSAGCGGALLSNDDLIAAKWKSLLDRPSDATGISELQAASLLPQLDRLEECNQRRQNTVRNLLARHSVAGLVGQRRPGELATHYKFAFLSRDRERLQASFEQAGLPVGEGYRSLHRSSDRRCTKFGSLPECQQIAEQILLLDHRALLAEGEAREGICDQLEQTLNSA